MDTYEQNKAIAHVCGWRWLESADYPGMKQLVAPDGSVKSGGIDPAYPEAMKTVFELHVPNYTADLNAMYEAETHLSPSQAEMYGAMLVGPNPKTHWHYIHLSAAARAETFLRVLLLWDYQEPPPRFGAWWVIAHPGTGEPIECATFEEAMNKWFEGYNLPMLVMDNVCEPHAQSYERVKCYFATTGRQPTGVKNASTNTTPSV